MKERIQCRACTNNVLLDTAERYQGYCAPCARKREIFDLLSGSGKTWSDDILGIVYYHLEGGWIGNLDQTGINNFGFEVGNGIEPTSLRITIDCVNGASPPKKAVDLARHFLSGLSSSLASGLSVLHADIMGRGPCSGMWWYGCWEQIDEELKSYGLGLKFPESSEDLGALLMKPEILISAPTGDISYFHVIVCFKTIIDEEHGIGILFDGQKPVGLGSCREIQQFKG